MTIETAEQLKEFLAKWQEHTGVLAAESNYRAFVQALTFALGEIDILSEEVSELIERPTNEEHEETKKAYERLEAELDRIKNVEVEKVAQLIANLNSSVDYSLERNPFKDTYIQCAQAVKDFIIKGE